MKNTVKLFSAGTLFLIALAAFIGFAACDNGSGSGEPPGPTDISGRTSYVNGGEQVVLSAADGNSGTYTLNTPKGSAGSPDLDDNQKYIWEARMEGVYAWNRSAQTVTLTPEKLADDDGLMTDKTAALSLFKDWLAEEIENEIEGRLAWSGTALNETRGDAEAAVLESRNEVNGTAYTTLNEFIDALAALRLDETFASSSYTYTFSSDGVSLILLEALPAPKGTDQLAGKTYCGTISNFLGTEPNEDHTFVFSASGRTYTEVNPGGAETSSGSYSYDSEAKRVYLKRTTRNGQNPGQFYDEAPYFPEFDRYPSEADRRTSETYQHFKLIHYGYDPDAKVIDSGDSGELNPL